MADKLDAIDDEILRIQKKRRDLDYLVSEITRVRAANRKDRALGS